MREYSFESISSSASAIVSVSTPLVRNWRRIFYPAPTGEAIFIADECLGETGVVDKAPGCERLYYFLGIGRRNAPLPELGLELAGGVLERAQRVLQALPKPAGALLPFGLRKALMRRCRVVGQ